MIFTKRKDDTTTIRKVWNDEKSTCYGIVGTVADLEKEEIIFDIDIGPANWLFLPFTDPDNGAFGATRKEAVQHLT